MKTSDYLGVIGFMVCTILLMCAGLVILDRRLDAIETQEPPVSGTTTIIISADSHQREPVGCSPDPC